MLKTFKHFLYAASSMTASQAAVKSTHFGIHHIPLMDSLC